MPFDPFRDSGPDPGVIDGPGGPLVSVDKPGRAAKWQFTPELGDLIAELYVDEQGGLWGLAAAMPDKVPPPNVVTAWKRQFPAFGLAMREAEKLRAEKLVEETLVIADTDPAPAPRVALRIAARQHYAERLDRARFGNASAAGNTPAIASDAQPVAIEASDAQLAAIALSGQSAGADSSGEN